MLYRKKDGKYELGNQIGRTDSFLLIPKDWYIENETSFTIIDYQWGNRIIQGIEIPSDFIDNIIVKGADGIITFGMASPLYWTEMATPPLYIPDVIEPLYNAENSIFLYVMILIMVKKTRGRLTFNSATSGRQNGLTNLLMEKYLQEPLILMGILLHQ